MSRGVARIDEHGLVGDLRTTAVISTAGTVDSLCLSDADSPTIFAAVLDAGLGGHLSIELVDIPDGEEVRRRQDYLPDINILITRLQGAGAITQIRDSLLPVQLAGERVGVLVRQVTALHGSPSVHLACWPGFHYARADHRAVLSDDCRTVDFVSDTGHLRLHCSHDLHLNSRDRGPEAAVDVDLERDEVVTVVLEWVEPRDGDSADQPVETAARTVEKVDGWAHATEHYRHSWVDSTSYAGGWADAVRRSALCLKLLQHQPTGGIVAAPTFGLPEWPGADLNRDYRYVWLDQALKAGGGPEQTGPDASLTQVSTVYEGIDSDLAAWLTAQPMFVVGTAPLDGDGLINVSPKGLAGTFAVLDEHRVAYLDLTGSGVETIAHLRQNGRIVLMFTAFDGKPNIVRLHGRGEVALPGEAQFTQLLPLFPDHPGVRSIIVVTVQRVSDSCGYAVPKMRYLEDRRALDASNGKQGVDALAAYRKKKNSASLDGLPGLD